MPKFIFTSDTLPSELPVRQRAKMWAESMKAIGSSFDMGIVASRKFRGEVVVMALGKVQLGAATTVADGPVSVIRTREKLASDHDDRVMVVINDGETPMRVRQFDRQVTLARGEMTVVGLDAPSECWTPRSGRSLVAMIPREMIDRPGQMLERQAATGLTAERGAQTLFLSHVRDLLDGNVTIDESTEAAAGDYIAHLAGVVLRLPGEQHGRTGNSHDPSRLQSIRKQIAQRYRVASLTPAELGKPLDLSGRSIQHVLRQEGTTFTKELTAARLEAAFGMLKSAQGGPIADIAFQCGFADLSTFYRAFRARYGDTPNAFRAGPKKKPAAKGRVKKSARKSGRNS